jgi:hypothetical protein
MQISKEEHGKRKCCALPCHGCHQPRVRGNCGLYGDESNRNSTFGGDIVRCIVDGMRCVNHGVVHEQVTKTKVLTTGGTQRTEKMVDSMRVPKDCNLHITALMDSIIRRLEATPREDRPKTLFVQASSVEYSTADASHIARYRMISWVTL